MASTVTQREDLSVFLPSEVFSDIFKLFIKIRQPILEAKEILLRRHHDRLLRDIAKIIEISEEKREMLLDALTDLVIDEDMDIEAPTRAWEKTSKTLTGDIEIGNSIARLDKELRTLNKNQSEKLYREMCMKLSGEIKKIRIIINDAVTEIKDIKIILAVDQFLYALDKMLITGLSSRKKFDPDILNKAAFSLLWLEALKRGKLKLENFYEFSSLLSWLSESKHVSKFDDSFIELTVSA